MPRRPPLRIFLAVVLGFALLGSVVAFAASLVVTPKRLTIYASCILRSPSADTDVDQGSPTSSFGTSSDLYVRSKSGSANRRGLVKFSLANCAIPSTATIKSARLSMYVTGAPGTSRTYEAHRVTSTWSETTTWNSQPTVAGSATSTTTTGTTNDVRIEWDVAADVQAYVGGTTNEGWRLKDATENAGASPETKFASRQYGTASSRPKLTIAYYP